MNLYWKYLTFLIACSLYIPHSAIAATAWTSVLFYDWTDETSGTVGATTQNYNRPGGNNWGISNRSDQQDNRKVLPYSMTDPGMTGPYGEEYGIELEFGDLGIVPRSINSRSVRFYVDCGQTGFQSRKHDRAELFMSPVLSEMDVHEGDSLWIGWSEYYRNIDKSRISTVLQLRNQPSPKSLEQQGISPITTDIYKQVINGGPAVAIELMPNNQELHYHFAVRDGSPDNWKIPDSNKHTPLEPIYTGIWYDFIINIKYSRNNDGHFRVWHARPGGTLKLDSPTWTFNGPTMYQYPTINGIAVQPEPSIRWGLYRYGCKAAGLDGGTPPIDMSNRYMTKFLGPVRFWKGNMDIGFSLVKPED